MGREDRDARHYADVDEDVRLMDELSKAAMAPREAGSAQKFNTAFADVVCRLADYRARIDALEGRLDY